MSKSLRLMALKLATLSASQRNAILEAFSPKERSRLLSFIDQAIQLPIVAYPELVEEIYCANNNAEAETKKDLSAIRSAPFIWQRYAAASLSEFEQQLLDERVLANKSSKNYPPQLSAAVALALTEAKNNNLPGRG